MRPASSPATNNTRSTTELLRSGLVTIASGIPNRDAPITLHNSGAALHCARLQAGDAVDLPAAPYLHAFVARGRVTCEGAGELGTGDAVRFTDTDGRATDGRRAGRSADLGDAREAGRLDRH